MIGDYKNRISILSASRSISTKCSANCHHNRVLNGPTPQLTSKSCAKVFRVYTNKVLLCPIQLMSRLGACPQTNSITSSKWCIYKEVLRNRIKNWIKEFGIIVKCAETVSRFCVLSFRFAKLSSSSVGPRHEPDLALIWFVEVDLVDRSSLKRAQDGMHLLGHGL